MPPRRAGQHARQTAHRHRDRLLAATALLVAFTVVAVLAFGVGSWGTAAVIWLLAGAIWLLDRFGAPVMERWSRGAAGEEHVGAILDGLPGWHVLHDVSLGRGNVDHVLVGPAGILTVETKSHPGRIDARRLPDTMANQAYAQKKLLERVTGREVAPLLVFSRAFLTPAVSRKKGVVVLPARMLPGHLARRPVVLSEAEAADVFARLSAALEPQLAAA